MVFSLKDSGIEIDPQYSEKMFEVFKRLRKKEEYPRTGIGPAICKKIVERYSEHIWVKSELGRVSTFFSLYQQAPENLKSRFVCIKE
jgi:light-regulated signal transduction histidine kinase (bacteriophytochrome)